MIPRLGDGNGVAGTDGTFKDAGLENDSPSRGRKLDGSAVMYSDQV